MAGLGPAKTAQKGGSPVKLSERLRDAEEESARPAAALGQGPKPLPTANPTFAQAAQQAKPNLQTKATVASKPHLSVKLADHPDAPMPKAQQPVDAFAALKRRA